MTLAPAVSNVNGLRDAAGGMLWQAFASAGVMPSPPQVDDDASSARLKQVVFTVTECSRITLLDPRFNSIVPKLDAYDDELQGFAYEGAGVGLAALD